MYKLVFQNRKFALIFAVMTIMSAVSMVGTPEDSGVVGRAATLAENARANREGGAPAPPPPAVFGDYTPGTEYQRAPVPAEDVPAVIDNAPIPMEPLK